MSRRTENLAETRRRTHPGAAGHGDAAYLLVLERGSSSLFPLPPGGAVVIGRGSEAGLRLVDASVSRRHACLRVEDGRVLVQDLGSSNGTTVNGERVAAPRALRSGDAVGIGDVTLVLHASPGAAPPREAEAPVTRLDLDGRVVLLADPAMVRLYDLIRRLAQSDLPVLVHGETGVGKENAAFAVHHFSARRRGPFVAINCAALPESLAESELFGHEKGAFSGAVGSRPGRLESAGGGTLFLDEVGELPPAIQAKLLRVLEQRRLTRVGDVREREVDIRIVAATNRDLEQEVQAGRFRKDLYFRLSAASVILPPLRNRPREVPELARMFLDQACARLGRPPLALSAAVLQHLCGLPWPGNVRELRNAMEYLAATVEGGVVAPDQVPANTGAQTPVSTAALSPVPAAAGSSPSGGFRAISDELREIERARMVEALAAAGGVRKRAAELLNMPLRTFGMKMKQYGIR